MRDWLTWLGRLRSPIVCCLQAGGPGKLMVQFWSKLKGLRTTGANSVVQVWVWRTMNQEHQHLRAGEDGWPSSSWANLPFLCIFGPQWIEWYLPVLVGRSSLLILLIQMLISSRNTLTDTLRNNVLSAICASFSSIKLTQKINHHTQASTP